MLGEPDGGKREAVAQAVKPAPLLSISTPGGRLSHPFAAAPSTLPQSGMVSGHGRLTAKRRKQMRVDSPPIEKSNLSGWESNPAFPRFVSSDRRVYYPIYDQRLVDGVLSINIISYIESHYRVWACHAALPFTSTRP
jgi:hypothetical protein